MGTFACIDKIFVGGNGNGTSLTHGLTFETLATGIELAYLVGNLSL